MKALILWLLGTFAAAALGSAATVDAGAFYAQLAKPAWAPPGSAFGPVWSLLYLLMGVAAWMVWRVRGFRAAPRTLGLYVVQLLANALWSWLFFAWHLGAAAFAWLAVLWLLVAATLIAFHKVRRAAAWLLAPYLAWITFAGFLAWRVWQDNPALLG